MTDTRADPSMIKASFDNWEQAMMARIKPSQNYILVAGRMYQRWTGASGLSLFETVGGAMWAPPIEDIRGMHFWRDGVSHDDAIERCLAWVSAYSDTVPILSTPDRDFGLPLVIDWRAPFQWQCERLKNVTISHASLTMQYGNFKLIGDDWPDEDPYGDWTFHDYAAATMTAAEVEAVTREQFYRSRKSGQLFILGAGSSKVNFLYPKIDCNHLGGGVQLSANSNLIGAVISHVAGHGVTSKGGSSISGCNISQWQIGDAEYFNPDEYTGICVLVEDTDQLVEDCDLSWAAELVRFEKTNCKISRGHQFNGMQQYNAAERTSTSDEAYDAYFEYWMGKGNPHSFATADDIRTFDFPPRDKHTLFVTASRRDKDTYEANPAFSPSSGIGNSRQDTTFENNYVDNGHIDCYTGGIKIIGLDAGMKKTSSLSPGITAVIRMFATGENANPRCFIGHSRAFIESTNFSPTDVNKHWVEMLPGLFGEEWTDDFTVLNANETYNWISTTHGQNGFGLDIGGDRVTISLQGGGVPAMTWYNGTPGSYVAFEDSGTTERVLIGLNADEFRIKRESEPKKFGVDLDTGLVTLATVPTHANDAAAGAAGLTEGQLYKQAAGGPIYLKT